MHGRYRTELDQNAHPHTHLLPHSTRGRVTHSSCHQPRCSTGECLQGRPRMQHAQQSQWTKLSKEHGVWVEGKDVCSSLPMKELKLEKQKLEKGEMVVELPLD